MESPVVSTLLVTDFVAVSISHTYWELPETVSQRKRMYDRFKHKHPYLFSLYESSIHTVNNLQFIISPNMFCAHLTKC